MSSNRFSRLLALLVIVLLLSGSNHAAASNGPATDQPASPASKQQSSPQVADPPAWHNDYPLYNSVKMLSSTEGWAGLGYRQPNHAALQRRASQQFLLQRSGDGLQLGGSQWH